MQSALLRQWLFHFKKAQRSQMADRRLARRESFQTGQAKAQREDNGFIPLVNAATQVWPVWKDSEE